MISTKILFDVDVEFIDSCLVVGMGVDTFAGGGGKRCNWICIIFGLLTPASVGLVLGLF